MKFIPPEVSDLAPVFQQYDKVGKSHIVDATGQKYEPRCYFQEYVFATDQELSFPDTVAWRNGEQFPVVISLTAAGHQLKEQASLIPECMLRATKCALPEIQTITRQIQALRERLTLHP